MRVVLNSHRPKRVYYRYLSSSEAGRRDFLLSFNSADCAWAEWIAAELESNGYTTFFQHWDFRPGSNFVLEMHKAAALADRTIAVLSPDYLSALFTQPEWAAALVLDPTGSQRKLIPVRVQPCEPDGLLKPIVYADLVGLNEVDARARLIAAVSGDRPKPAAATPPRASATRFPGSEPADLRLYAILSLGCFLLGVALLFLMLWKAEILTQLGLTGKLFYVVLLPMGLAAAGFLFGVLRSVAIYRGEQFGGTLVMGGPIVAMALVVWGGFALPPPESGDFAMTVFVHGPGGPQDMVLRGQGKIVMDLRGNRRPETIDEKGAAHFPAIPADFHARAVPISLEANGFELADPGPRKLIGETLYLPVRKSAGRLNGVVVDQQGEPVAGAAIDVEGMVAETDSKGRFQITVPGDRVRSDMTLDVRARGFQGQTHGVTPGANEIRLRLVARSR